MEVNYIAIFTQVSSLHFMKLISQVRMKIPLVPPQLLMQKLFVKAALRIPVTAVVMLREVMMVPMTVML